MAIRCFHQCRLQSYQHWIKQQAWLLLTPAMDNTAITTAKLVVEADAAQVLPLARA
jgi:hypothetical protein